LALLQQKKKMELERLKKTLQMDPI